MNNAEETVLSIKEDLKNSRFEHEIPKKELNILISKYTTFPYPYINRLLLEGVIQELNPHVFKIVDKNG